MAAWMRPGMRVLKLHGVPEGPALEQFEAQMRWVARRFEVVPLETLLRKAEGNGRPGKEVALTFDDGLRNNATRAYPVLRKLGLPATFFVCPGLMDGSGWLWNHEARERLKTLDAESRTALFGRLSAGDVRAGDVVEWMKTLSLGAREAAQAEVRAATPGFTPSPQQREAFDIMRWEDLDGMDAGLITLGSHTMTHPILTGLDADRLEFEVRESRRVLEERRGRPVEFFCYPNGAWNASVREHVRACYRAAVGTARGLVRPGHNDLYQLNRIPFEGALPLVAWNMHRL